MFSRSKIEPIGWECCTQGRYLNRCRFLWLSFTDVLFDGLRGRESSSFSLYQVYCFHAIWRLHWLINQKRVFLLLNKCKTCHSISLWVFPLNQIASTFRNWKKETSQKIAAGVWIIPVAQRQIWTCKFSVCTPALAETENRILQTGEEELPHVPFCGGENKMGRLRRDYSVSSCFCAFLLTVRPHFSCVMLFSLLFFLSFFLFWHCVCFKLTACQLGRFSTAS